MSTVGDRIRRFLPAILGAVLLNAALLLLLTHLSRERPVRQNFGDAVPVRLVHRDPPEELEEVKRKPPKPPEPKQRPEFTPELMQPSLARFDAPDIGVVIDASRFGPSPDGQFVFDMADVDQQPQPIVSTEPVYPERPLRLGIEGKVVVKFLVASDGSVQQVEIIEAKPEGLFEEAVLKAVASWRFRPGTIAGKPVSSWWSREIEFELTP